MRPMDRDIAMEPMLRIISSFRLSNRSATKPAIIPNAEGAHLKPVTRLRKMTESVVSSTSQVIRMSNEFRLRLHRKLFVQSKRKLGKRKELTVEGINPLDFVCASNAYQIFIPLNGEA